MLKTWGDALDQDLVLIATASADPQHFDRPAMQASADFWCDNAYRLFGGTGELPDPHATLPPTRHRDYLGRVRAIPEPLSPEVVDDYDLSTAILRRLVVERSGGGLCGRVVVAVERRFAGSAEEPAELAIKLGRLSKGLVNVEDVAGLELLPDGGVRLGGGLLRGAEASVWIDDQDWYLSRAGQAADAVTPPTVRPARDLPRTRQSLGAAATHAENLVSSAMLEVRVMASSPAEAWIPVNAVARAFAGAGRDVVAATSAVRREAAFRRLIRRWTEAGGDELAPWFRGEPMPRLMAGGGTDLLMVDYDAGNSRRSAVAHVLRAVPDRARQHLSTVERPAGLTVDLRAFSNDLERVAGG
ncbi:hypothetical protein GCM10027269_20460 [Kribbella endophytica]